MKLLGLKGCAFLIILLLQITRVYASHMSGAEITYKCLDASGNYKVTLVYYRSCSGIPTCSGSCMGIDSCKKSMTVRGAYPACNGTYITFHLSGVSVRDMNVNSSCPHAKSNCTNMGCVTAGTVKGMERYEFAGTVNIGPGSGIPASCCNLVFAFEECCRNGAIQNISPQNFYTQAVINRCNVTFPNCNSVVFQNDFPTTYCYNQGFIYNPGAFDPDMDSLSYEFTSALYGYGVSATYISPYSYNQPLPYKPPLSGAFPLGMHLNAVTGDFMFTPNATNFTGVVGFLVKEWRKINGLYKLVGENIRNFEVNITTCNGENSMPVLSHVPGTPNLNLNYEICTGKPLCIPILALDADFSLPTRSDTTYLSWDKRLEAFGATFTRTYDSAARSIYGPREDSYKICWTPQNNACPKNLPTTYTFTVTARDNQCPNPGFNVQLFNIRVIPSPAVAFRKVNQNCGVWDVKLVNDSVQKPQTFAKKEWIIAKEPGDYTFMNGADTLRDKDSIRLQFFKPGNYLLKVHLQIDPFLTSCEKIIYDTLSVNAVLGLKLPNDTIVCRLDNPAPITLNAAINASNPVKLSWYALPDTNQIIHDSISYFLGTHFGDLHLLVVATDTILNCRTTDEIHISDMLPKAKFTILESPVCAPLVVQPVDASLPASTLLSYVWTVDTTQIFYGPHPSFSILNGGMHEFKLRVHFGSCSDSTTLMRIYYSKPLTPEIEGPANAFKKVQTTYSVTDHPFTTYQWSVLFGTIINENKNTISVLWGEQNYGEVHVKVTRYGCTSEDGYKHVWLSYVGVPEFAAEQQFTIYPQPAQDILHLKGNYQQFSRYELFTLTGQRLEWIEETADFPDKINLKGIDDGVYILMFYTRDGLAIGRKISVIR